MSLRTLQDRIIAADPALVRLYMAVRATASVGTSLAILLALRTVFHYQLSDALVGVPLGMMAINAVMDARRRDQQITTLLLCLPAAVSLVVGTYAFPNRILSDALFVVVLFVAIFVRQYGPRAAAMGVILFIVFFFALVFRIAPQDIPLALLSIVVTDLCTYIYRFVVFRDNPRLSLRNAAAAFRARQRLIAATIAGVLCHGSVTKRLQSTLDRHLFRLNETALFMHDILRNREDHVRVLEAELTAGEAVRSTVQGAGPRPQIEPLQLPDDARVDPDWTPRAPFRVGTQIDTGRIPQTLRQAIQLSAAGIFAILLGEIVSAERWYWAVLTAFIVFLGTSSSSEIRSRAWARVLGTAFGVIAAMLLSFLVLRHKDLAFAVLMFALFATVYTLRLSYAVFTFFLTTVIFMLYLLLGMFNDQLLVLRLVETALGALLGGLAAALLLPISTKRVLFNVTVEALKQLNDLVASAVARLSGDPSADPVGAARKFDEALQSARMQVEPLITRPHAESDQVFQRRLLLMTACGYYARALASLAYQQPEGCPIPVLYELRDTIARDIRAILEYNEGAPALSMSQPPATTTVDGLAATYLLRIDHALHGLARTLSDEA